MRWAVISWRSPKRVAFSLVAWLHNGAASARNTAAKLVTGDDGADGESEAGGRPAMRTARGGRGGKRLHRQLYSVTAERRVELGP